MRSTHYSGRNNTSTTWSGSRPLSRRSFVRGAGLTALGLGGAALIGCGSDEDATAAPTAAATTAAPGTAATETPAEAAIKTGGIYRVSVTQDPPTLDPYGSASFRTKAVAAYAYSRLFQVDAQPAENPYNRGLIGDLAESAETEDGQHWVVKLKQGVTFHDIDPVNGREVTADDVLFSWDMLKGPTSVSAVNVEDIVNLEVVDSHTLQFTVAGPSAIFLEKLADANNLWVLPTEADGGFDRLQRSIGSGPWMLANYQVASRLEFARNPNYHFEGRPYLDGVTENIIPEYANSKAQFEAGNIDVIAVAADDVLDMYSRGTGWQWVGQITGGVHYAFFSSEEMDPNAPWRDERYRIATSMAINRDELMDLSHNVRALDDAGLAPSRAWNNAIAVTLGDWWLDPTSEAQGPSAANFQFNPTEARRLVEAVGATDVELKFQWAGATYGAAFDRMAEATANFIAEVGIPVTVDVQDYSSTYFPQTRAGNFNGVALGTTPAYPEVAGFVDRYFSSGSSNASRINDPAINDLRAKQAVELDPDARREQMHEIQRINAQMMYYLPTSTGAGTSFVAYQAGVRGIRNTRGYGGPTEVYAHYWLDT